MRPRLLPFVDAEIAEALTYHLRERRVTLRLGEKVEQRRVVERNGGEPHVRVILESGKQIVADKALSCMGRAGAVSKLNLAAAGVTTEARGKIKVNHVLSNRGPAHLRHRRRDRLSRASPRPPRSRAGSRCVTPSASRPGTRPSSFPTGSTRFPEISFVGQNEEELTEQGIPYEVGKAHYREIARGQILGDNHGMLKLIFHRETHDPAGRPYYRRRRGRSWCISGRRCWRPKAISTISSIRCSTIRRWPNATKTPPSTASIDCSASRAGWLPPFADERLAGSGIPPIPGRRGFYLAPSTGLV